MAKYLITKTYFNVEKIFIPVATDDQQRVFEELHHAIKQLKTKSRELLKSAKRAVEIAIEEDEPTALAYLKKERGNV